MASPKGETNHDQDVQHLFRAIRKGKAHLTKFMLAASNNSLLNCWNTDGRTPLIECCYIKEEVTRSHMVRILKDAGADVNMKDKNGKTALIHACEQRCNDIVKTLIQHANICPDQEDVDGNTALIHSANIGNDVALELLVKNFRRLGLNVDHYNKAGYTALHVATTNGFMQCAKLLAVKGKASLTLKDKVHQLTPLEWCLKEGYQKSEVEFLKPSAKFYRVAKLTTTMVKYRKKSTQETIVSSQVSPKTSPIRSTEKPKSKVKSLLRRTKTHSTDETDLSSAGAVCLQTQKSAESKSSEKKSMSKFLEKSKATFMTKGSQRLGKSSRQRSFSQPDQQEEDHASIKVKTGLTHSRSHPVTSKYFEVSNTNESSKEDDDNEQNEHQEYLTLPDEYGECDTDDIDNDNSDIDSGFLPTTINEVKAVFYGEGSVFCGEITSSSETPGYGNSSSGDGVYYSTSSTKSDDTSTRHSNTERTQSSASSANDRHSYHRGGTPLRDIDSRSCTECTPSPVFSVSGFDEPSLTSENEDESSCSSSEGTNITFVNASTNFNTDKLIPPQKEERKRLCKHNISQEVRHGSVNTNVSERSISVTDSDSISNQTDWDYIDAVSCAQGLNEVPVQEMSWPADSHVLYNASSKKISNSVPGQTASKDILLKSHDTTRHAGSPQTETEYIECDDSSESPNVPSPLCDVVPSSTFSIGNSKPKNSITENASSAWKIERYVASPDTEEDILDHENYDKHQVSRSTRTFDSVAKHYQKVTRSQSETVHQRRPVSTLDRYSFSPQTEIEFLDLRIPEEDTETRKHVQRESSSEDNADGDKNSDDFNDRAHFRSTVKKSIRCFSDNVMRLVDHATGQGFVVENKHDRDLSEVQTDRAVTCEESDPSSEVDTLIVNLESEVSSHLEDSTVECVDERIHGMRENSETDLMNANTVYDSQVRDDLLAFDEDARSSNMKHIVNSKDFTKPYRVK